MSVDTLSRWSYIVLLQTGCAQLLQFMFSTSSLTFDRRLKVEWEWVKDFRDRTSAVGRNWSQTLELINFDSWLLEELCLLEQGLSDWAHGKSHDTRREPDRRGILREVRFRVVTRKAPLGSPSFFNKSIGHMSSTLEVSIWDIINWAIICALFFKVRVIFSLFIFNLVRL